MPRKLSQAKYRNNSIRINRAGLKKLRVVINEWMAFMRKAAVKGVNQQVKILKSDRFLFIKKAKGTEL